MSEPAGDDPRVDALHQRMAEHSLGGHWQKKQRDPNPKLVPHLWPWETVYSCLLESGEVIKLGGINDAAKRRTVNLVNPSIPDLKATSRTLQMSVQLVKPGEMAECHRHTAGALRFVVEGEGAGYTNVNGHQMIMEPNDLVLTPNWTWHDHQNPGEKALVWLDVLDIHLIGHLDINIHENYQDARDGQGNYFGNASQPVLHPDGFCQQRYGAIRRRACAEDDRFIPYAYKWTEARAALDAMSEAGERDPHDGVLLDYVNPATGGPTMPTIHCRVQMLAPGEETRPHRHSSSTIYHVIEGEGGTVVGDDPSGSDEMGWIDRDCFFIPSMDWHFHRNKSKADPAILFSVSDKPVLEGLGLYREEHA